MHMPLITTDEELNPYRIAQQQVDHAARYLPHLRPGLISFLERTARIVSVDFPIETDDGSIHMFTGYRALHSRIRGPLPSRRDRG
jgi:glutamate dehydrogenase/leucine dehydrogenase